MNNYLDTLLEKTIHPDQGVQPRPISVFEPLQDRGNPPIFNPNPQQLPGENEITVEEGESTSGFILPRIYRKATESHFPYGSGISQPPSGSEANDVHNFEGELKPMPWNQVGLPESQVRKEDPDNRYSLEPIQLPTHSERRVPQNIDLVRDNTIQPAESESINPKHQDLHKKSIRVGQQIQDLEIGEQHILKPILRSVHQEPEDPHKEEFLSAGSNMKPSINQWELPAAAAARSTEPTIHVTIGRVEVRATQANTTPGKTQVKKAISLDDYLRQRQGGKS